MIPKTKSLITVLAVLGLSACSNPPFGGGEEYRAAPPVGAGGGLAPNSPGYFMQTVGDRVLFDVDQHTLNASAMAVLDGQAQWFLANPDYFITIEGHADEQGTREYNLALGARRAQAVQNYLLSRGVPVTRMTTLSYGKERPIEICSTESCYAKNRRAVSVITGGIS
ncbi:MAG: peptidoglycan-associated lipoprotein Pal [Pseudomonadota bacterium]